MLHRKEWKVRVSLTDDVTDMAWFKRFWTKLKNVISHGIKLESGIQNVPNRSLLEEDIKASLESLSKQRFLKVRKRQGHNIWKVCSANFVDAYLFLINLPCMKHSWLQEHVQGDKINICMNLADEYVLELTEGRKCKGAEALLHIRQGRRSILSVYFYDDERKMKR